MKKISLLFLLLALISVSVAQDSTRVFTLDECVRSAIENSPQAAQIRAQQNQTLTGILTSLSPVLPYVSLSSRWNRSGPQAASIVDVPGGEPIITQEPFADNVQASVSVVQNLLDLASFAQIGQIPQIDNLASEQYLQSIADLAFQVKEQYYNLIVLYNNLSVSDAALEQIRQQAEIAREQFRLGVIARPELLRVEVALLQRQVERVNALAALVNGRRALANLIGSDYPVRIDTSVSFPDTLKPLPPPEVFNKLVLERNPSYLISATNLKLQETAETVSKLRIVPSVNGSFTYGYSSPDWFTQWQDNDFWQLGVELSWSIFERLSWYAQVREASAQTQIVKANVDITRNNVILQMNQAYASLVAAREALVLVPQLLEQANEEQRLTGEQFRLGAASSLDFLQSQLTFIQAQQQAVQVLVNYHLAQAQIQQLLGEW